LRLTVASSLGFPKISPLLPNPPGKQRGTPKYSPWLHHCQAIAHHHNPEPSRDLSLVCYGHRMVLADRAVKNGKGALLWR